MTNELLLIGTLIVLYGAVLHSPHPHARILRVDTAAAGAAALNDASTGLPALADGLSQMAGKSAELTGGLTTLQQGTATLAQQTLYAAQRLSDGSVIRMASAQQTVVVVLLSMIQPILLILGIALIISAVLASRMTRGIIRPIVSLDLEHPENCDTYQELVPLLTRVKRQNETIQRQMAQLSQQQQEFSALTENMSEGFLLLDRRGRVLSYNSGALSQLGAQPPKGEVNVLVLNRSEGFQRAVDDALEGRKSCQMIHQGGRWCQVLANPVLRDGEQAGVVMVLLDVTEQEQREELRREFTANVSHELKTPLTAISGIAEIMRGGMVKPEDIEDFAGDIYQEAQRLIALVEDIIRLSRLDEGEGGLEREDVDLLKLSDQVVHRLEPAARKQDVALKVTGRSVKVHGVASVLEEMLYNLCDNAIKYNKPGGRVTVTVDYLGQDAQVQVEDTGIGIPQEDQSRVFERFYRVDKSHSKEIGGTGLGLSIVKHGAALHDGQVRLESTPGKGTKVTLVMPTGTEE